MKKSILTLFACLIAGIVFAQPKEAVMNEADKANVGIVAKSPVKQDTTIAVQMNINQFRSFLYAIDQNVDSKKVSKELLEFLQNSAKIIQPKDKPNIISHETTTKSRD